MTYLRFRVPKMNVTTYNCIIHYIISKWWCKGIFFWDQINKSMSYCLFIYLLGKYNLNRIIGCNMYLGIQIVVFYLAAVSHYWRLKKLFDIDLLFGLLGLHSILEKIICSKQSQGDDETFNSLYRNAK